MGRSESDKVVTRFLAVILSLAMILPITGVSEKKAWAGSETSSGWLISAENTAGGLPSEVAQAFDMAVQTYEGETLVPLACYGTQVVAGENLYLICRQGAQLKEVVIYKDLNEQSSIENVKDFNLDDYAMDHQYELPPAPLSGGVEVYRLNVRCTLPQEAAAVFDAIYRDVDGVSVVPVAYLGSKSDNGTDYAFLCLENAVVPNPDMFVDVEILHKNVDGTIIQKTAYELLGTRIDFSYAGGNRNENGKLTVTFSGDDKNAAGYAQGTVTLSVDVEGTYYLYWADNQKALNGYKPFGTLKLGDGASGSVTLGYHTVIPAGATKIIATTGAQDVAGAYSVYSIPLAKQFNYASGRKLYSFSAFSDIHIDKAKKVYYSNAEAYFREELRYSADMDTDYVIVSGDCVTNASGPDAEWDAYTKILSQSDYVNPVWESDGNHDMRQDVESGLKSFIKGSGTDGSKSGKSYYSMIEPTSGDLFIFMALELIKSPSEGNTFSDEQLAWVRNLLENNYNDRNIFIVEHSPINGYGAGDRMENPYYPALLSQDYSSTKAFKKILKEYPNVIFLSGHTHEDFEMGYNYFDDNGNAASMLHIPSLAGSTQPNAQKTDLDRNGGLGFNSQGYYVEVYQNKVVFYGVDILEKKIYPQYSYIMEGSRTAQSPVGNITEPVYTGADVSAAAELSRVSSVLSLYYQYASYDSYQSLKKLYYQYKSCERVPQGVIDEFEARINALSVYTGEIRVYPLKKTYYFINNKSWSNVYAYAWNDSGHNAEWPGVKLQKSGTNSSGKDVYRVDFAYAGEYDHLIFNVGSNTGQTVDIPLAKYAYDSFSIGSTDNGKYKVNNLVYGDESASGVSGDRVALLYYVSEEHAWSDTDTYFTLGDDGKYRLTYHATGDKTFSFSLYNKSSGKYYCVSESQKMTYAQDETFGFSVEKMSARGKSISVYGLSETADLELEFDPAANSISIKCCSSLPPVLTGWQNIDDVWYYYNGDGSAYSGWLEEEAGWYYFGENGTMQTGWQKISQKWYHFAADGVMETGWQQVGGKWYYLCSDGAMATGWRQVSGKWYYLCGDGAMATGWRQVNGKWYYLCGDGAMATGWKQIGGKWYYLCGDGAMATGWRMVSGKWYYLDGSGVMVAGWKQIGGKWYFFKKSGEMAANEWCDGYWLNDDGTWTYGYKASWKQDSTGWWYGDTSGWYAKNTVIVIDGKRYRFNERGYLQ